jgi:hypothetical protein
MNTKAGRMIILAGLLAAMAGPAATHADEVTDMQKAAKQFGAALVSIKFVLKMEGQFGDRENETEVTGVMIDPGGLVLASSSQLGTPRFMRRFGNATPTDIKVLLGDDTEGLPAKVLARDTELDLAWVQLKEPGKKKFDSLDLSKAAQPAVGQSLLFLRKMGKYFDRAMTVSDLRVAGRTGKPRDLFIPTGGASLEPGLPVFTPAGEVVGIVVLQLPDADELESNMGALAGLGRDIGSGLILPTAEVIKATERAKRGEIKGDEEAAAGDAADKKPGPGDGDDDDDGAPAAKPAPRPADDDEEEDE